jgi:high-affinity iron transporter
MRGPGSQRGEPPDTVLDVGALSTGFLTGLREGVEAALIVSIVLAYLARTGNGRHFGKIWLGAGGAIATSVLAGAAIFLTAGGLEAPYEQAFEGTTLLLAAIVVTWMLFWMRRQSAAVKGELQAAIDRVLTEGSVWGLAILAFTAVIREGIETALFLASQATAAKSSGTSVILGAVLGLLLAAAIGYGFYHGSRRIHLGSFFRWTGIALIFIAAGLLSHAVHEFIEINVINVGTQTAFDISAVMPHETGIGQFLRALFGYTSTPEVATLIVWLAYLVVVLALYLRPIPPRAPAARPSVPATH